MHAALGPCLVTWVISIHYGNLNWSEQFLLIKGRLSKTEFGQRIKHPLRLTNVFSNAYEKLNTVNYLQSTPIITNRTSLLLLLFLVLFCFCCRCFVLFKNNFSLPGVVLQRRSDTARLSLTPITIMQDNTQLQYKYQNLFSRRLANNVEP